MSRYKTDFEELCVLGRGGFGFVTKCRSNFGGDCLYAIKCIAMKVQNMDFMLREASNLARLHHKNVVRYFTAWLEHQNNNSEVQDTRSDFSSYHSRGDEFQSRRAADSRRIDSFPDLKLISKTARTRLISHAPGVDSFWQQDVEDNSEENFNSTRGWYVGFEESSAVIEKQMQQNWDSSSSCHPINKPQPAHNNDQVSKLYIVMEFVEGCTLRSLITNNLVATPALGWEIFGEILDGIAYMHKNKLLHRDLKPENIFLKSINQHFQVKIGDLGLSKSLDHVSTNLEVAGAVPLSNLSCGVGTHFYIAPEVEAGASYDQAADIYALGVVLFEIFHPPFATTMERHKILSELQKTRKVEGVVDSRAAMWVAQMLSPDTSARPSAANLLEQCRSTFDIKPIVDQLIRHPYSYEMLKILACIFNRREDPTRIQGFWSQTNHLATESSERQLIVQYVHHVARSCNAIYFDAPVLIPFHDKFPTWFEKSSRLLDTSGSSLQPPSCMITILKDTMPAAQGATVVRRYTVDEVEGEIAFAVERRLHVAYDVVCNQQKLLSVERLPNSTGFDGVIKDFILESEPVHVATQIMKPFQSYFEVIYIDCFYGRLLPLMLSCAADITVDAAHEVLKLLIDSSDMRAAVLKTQDVEPLERRRSFSEVEFLLRRMSKMAETKGMPTEIVAIATKFVEDMCTSISPELQNILDKVACWQNLSLPFNFPLEFYIYMPYSRQIFRSTDDYGFVISTKAVAITAVSPYTTIPVCGVSLNNKAAVLGVGGSACVNKEQSYFVEIDLQTIIDAREVQLATRRHLRKGFQNRSILTSVTSLKSGNEEIKTFSTSLPISTPWNALVWSKSLPGVSENPRHWKKYVELAAKPPSLGNKNRKLLVAVCIVERELLAEAYKLKQLLANLRVCSRVYPEPITDFGKAKRKVGDVHDWIIYVGRRKNWEAGYKVSSTNALMKRLDELDCDKSSELRNIIEKSEKWFELVSGACMSLHYIMVELYNAKSIKIPKGDKVEAGTDQESQP